MFWDDSSRSFSCSGCGLCHRRFTRSFYRQPTATGFALGGSLPACIAEDREIVEALTPLIDAYEQELRAWRALDPHVVIVEVIWSASHTEKEISTAEITKASSRDFAKQILGFVFHRSIRYNCYTHAISLR